MTHTLQPDPPLFLTIDEAARMLRIGRSLAYELAHQGEIPVVRLGKRRWLVPYAALQAMAQPSHDDRARAASTGDGLADA